METLQPLNKSVNETPVSVYIGALLRSVAVVHAMHLTTTSYARHKALDEYYNDMPELIDAFAESYLATEKTMNVILDARIGFGYTSAESLLMALKANGLQLHANGMCPSLTNPLEDVLTKINAILYKLKLQ